MKTRFMLERPDDCEATLKITMTLKEWDQLRAQLSHAWPSWKLSSAITDLLTQARKVFHADHEAS